MNYIGDVIRIKSSFFDEDGALVDPTEIVLKIKPPFDELVTVTLEDDEIQKEATGIYYYDYSVESGGTHEYRLEATGALVKATQGSFFVEAVNV